MMMEAVRTSETSIDIHLTRQYIPEDNSEHYIFTLLNLFSCKVTMNFFLFSVTLLFLLVRVIELYVHCLIVMF
jgi:hypothetical protein